MKKSFYAIILLLGINNLYADTVTSGSVGLILPTTGVYSTRPASDKNNENFRIIAATVGANITAINNLNVATGTFASKLDVANTTSTLANNVGVATTSVLNRADAVAVATGNIQTLLTTSYYNIIKTTPNIDGGVIYGGNITATFFNGNGSLLTGISAGGGASITTYPVTFTFGNAVQITTSPFDALGTQTKTGRSTYTMTSVDCWGVSGSTVGSTWFKIALSTDIGNSRSFTYITPHVEMTTGTTWSGYLSTVAVINANSFLSLHILGVPGAVPGSGAQRVGVGPVGGGCNLWYFRND